MARARLCARHSHSLGEALGLLSDCELTLGGKLTKSGRFTSVRFSFAFSALKLQMNLKVAQNANGANVRQSPKGSSVL